MLVIDSITKRYRRLEPVNRDVSFTVEPGQLTALLGHNGAGKTTLLTQICGVAKPTSGDIRLGDVSLVRNPAYARRACSLMAQLHAPLNGITPRAAISSVARIRGLSPSEARAQTDDVIRRLSMEEWADRAGHKLSGGLRRMTSYGMATVVPAPVLLIDEPTNDVDPERRPVIWKDLRHLAERGHIVLVVSHNLLEVERAADRVLLMKEGQVILDGSPRDLSGSTGTSTLKVVVRQEASSLALPPCVRSEREPAGQVALVLAQDQIPAAARWAAQLHEDGRIESFVLEPASLESVYAGVHA